MNLGKVTLLLLFIVAVAPSNSIFQRFPCLGGVGNDAQKMSSCFKKILDSIHDPKSVDPDLALQICYLLTTDKVNYTKQEKITHRTLCQHNANRLPKNAYTVIKLSLEIESYFEALKSEYHVFFSRPFSHEVQLRQVLNQRMLTQIKEQNVDKLDHLEKSIRLTYLSEFQGALKQLKTYFEQEKATKKDTDPQKVLYSRFLHLRLLDKLGLYSEGLQQSSEYIGKEGGEHFYLSHLLGNFQMHHVKYREAMNSFKKAIKQAKEQNQFAFSYYNLGLCQQKSGQIQEALISIKKSHDIAFDLKDISSELSNTLGYSYFSAAESEPSKAQIYLQKAQLHYNRSLKLNSNNSLPLYNLGVLKLNANNKQKAAEYFNLALKSNPEMQSASYGLFKAVYNKETRKESLQLLDKIKKRTPETLLEMAIILREVGQMEQALQRVDEGLKKVEHQDLLEEKGKIMYALEKYKQAQELLNKAIKLGKRSAPIYFNLGIVQVELKKHKLALASFKTANSIESRDQTKEMIKECEQILNQEL